MSPRPSLVGSRRVNQIDSVLCNAAVAGDCFSWVAHHKATGRRQPVAHGAGRPRGERDHRNRLSISTLRGELRTPPGDQGCVTVTVTVDVVVRLPASETFTQ